MAEFECSLKDLDHKDDGKNTPIEQTEELSRDDNVNDNVKIQKLDKEIVKKAPVDKETVNNFTTDTLVSKITEEKNIRIILLVIISYLITHSTQFTDFLQNTFPYLIEAGKTNLLGKIGLALIIGLTVVIFTSFFQGP